MSSAGVGSDYSTRIKEEELAWSKISKNIEVIFLESGIDTRLSEAYNEMVLLIEELIHKFNPEIIFTPYYNDTHQDHVAVSQATMSASRYRKNILFYETPSTCKFYPSVFFKLKNKILNMKKQTSAVYGSQILGDSTYKVTLSEIIEAKALSNGVTSRVCKFAEGFLPFKFFL
jgi:LmbE family N-acetylglucosaminyl deacetylase